MCYTKSMKNTKRNQELAAIHILAAELGLNTDPSKDRSAYEALLYLATGKRSAKYMTDEEREATINFLARTKADVERSREEVVTDEEALEILGY